MHQPDTIALTLFMLTALLLQGCASIEPNPHRDCETLAGERGDYLFEAGRSGGVVGFKCSAHPQPSIERLG